MAFENVLRMCLCIETLDNAEARDSFLHMREKDALLLFRNLIAFAQLTADAGDRHARKWEQNKHENREFEADSKKSGRL